MLQPAFVVCHWTTGPCPGPFICYRMIRRLIKIEFIWKGNVWVINKVDQVGRSGRQAADEWTKWKMAAVPSWIRLGKLIWFAHRLCGLCLALESEQAVVDQWLVGEGWQIVWRAFGLVDQYELGLIRLLIDVQLEREEAKVVSWEISSRQNFWKADWLPWRIWRRVSCPGHRTRSASGQAGCESRLWAFWAHQALATRFQACWWPRSWADTGQPVHTGPQTLCWAQIVLKYPKNQTYISSNFVQNGKIAHSSKPISSSLPKST